MLARAVSTGSPSEPVDPFAPLRTAEMLTEQDSGLMRIGFLAKQGVWKRLARGLRAAHMPPGGREDSIDLGKLLRSMRKTISSSSHCKPSRPKATLRARSSLSRAI